MFRFIKKVFVVAIGFTGLNINVNPLNSVLVKFVSLSNQECKVRPPVVNINSNEPLFYNYSILLNK